MKKRLVVGVSGASGAPLAVELLRALQANPEVETHLILTRGGEMTLRQEMGLTAADISALADFTHDNANIGAAPASGSWKSLGMVVCPCSMKTVAGIVSGYSDNLLLRAADCMLKERRKLVLVARETPFGLVHLRNMTALAEMGVTILPPMLTYYQHPQSIEDMTTHIVGKIMREFRLEGPGFRRWEGS